MENWLLLSFIAPVSWALVNVIDLWMAREVFDDEGGALAMIGLFGILPWLSVFFFGMPQVELYYALLSAAGGLLFAGFTFFYFRALYRTSDVAFLSIMLNLVGLLVPAIEAVAFGESLSIENYAGILVVVLGSTFACFGGGSLKFDAKVLLPIMIAVILFSACMVVENKVYEAVSFHGGLLYFSAGLFAGGLVCYLAKSWKQRRLYRVQGGASFAFIVSECVNIAGVAGSHYAIKICPSVSFIAVIETLVPIFVLLISLIAYGLWHKFSSNLAFIITLKGQFNGLWYKLIAVIVMAVGIYLIG